MEEPVFATCSAAKKFALEGQSLTSFYQLKIDPKHQ